MRGTELQVIFSLMKINIGEREREREAKKEIKERR